MYVYLTWRGKGFWPQPFNLETERKKKESLVQGQRRKVAEDHLEELIKRRRTM